MVRDLGTQPVLPTPGFCSVSFRLAYVGDILFCQVFSSQWLMLFCAVV